MLSLYDYRQLNCVFHKSHQASSADFIRTLLRCFFTVILSCAKSSHTTTIVYRKKNYLKILGIWLIGTSYYHFRFIDHLVWGSVGWLYTRKSSQIINDDISSQFFFIFILCSCLYHRPPEAFRTLVRDPPSSTYHYSFTHQIHRIYVSWILFPWVDNRR